MKQKNRKKFENGQSLTEFAVSITFIILILSGIVDLGRAYFTYISLRDAAQEGAIYGSINPLDCNKISRTVPLKSLKVSHCTKGGTKPLFCR